MGCEEPQEGARPPRARTAAAGEGRRLRPRPPARSLGRTATHGFACAQPSPGRGQTAVQSTAPRSPCAMATGSGRRGGEKRPASPKPRKAIPPSHTRLRFGGGEGGKCSPRFHGCTFAFHIVSFWRVRREPRPYFISVARDAAFRIAGRPTRAVRPWKPCAHIQACLPASNVPSGPLEVELQL